MKKLISILICILTVISLCACAEPELTENEKAAKMYERVLTAKENAIDTHYGEINLRDYIFQINGFMMEDHITVKNAVLDLDGDGVDEFVIEANAEWQIVLTYREGRVYCQRFYYKSFHELNTDGSFGWNDSNSEIPTVYGESKLQFKDGRFVETELWYMVNDGQFNAEYYIEGEAVTKDALTKYLEENPKTRAEYSELEIER